MTDAIPDEPTAEAIAEMSISDEEFRNAIERRKRASADRAAREAESC